MKSAYHGAEPGTPQVALADSNYELHLLGGWELRRADGVPVALRSRKARALLVILALRPGRGMSRGQLAGLLWGERAEAQARGSLRQALSELRRALDSEGAEVLRTSGEQVELVADRFACDVARFEALLAAGDRASLEQAVALYRGPFLDGFDLREEAFHTWSLEERNRLEARLLGGLERLASQCEAEGDPEEALAHLDRLLALAPLREEMHRRGMALCRSLGRSAEGIERYERLRVHLSQELAVEPQAESTRLYAELRAASGPAAEAPAAPARLGPEGGKPSIAVMPFVDLSGDPAQEFFADGMTEDIVTELSRFRGLFVIARSSTLAYKGAAVDVREVARELGVKYVLQGSVRGAGGRLRVSAQLIDAADRSHVWAERYDRELSDLFGIQDEIVRTLVAAVEPELHDAERRRAKRASPRELDAWGACHRGMWHVYRFTREDTGRALDLFARALEAVPHHVPGWVGRSFAHFSNAFLGFVPDRAGERRLCLEAARRAAELDPRDAATHWSLGRAHSLERDYERAIAALETAAELNVNHAQTWYQLGWVYVRAGRPAEAIEPLVLAERLSPNDPLRFAFLIARAQAHFTLGEYPRALALAERAAALPRAHAQIEAIRIACLVQDGQEEAARVAMATFRADHPGFGRAFFREAHGFAREEDVAPYLEALEEAGLPE